MYLNKHFSIRYGHEISVGHLVLAQSNDEFIPAEVTHISSHILQGSYAYSV